MNQKSLYRIISQALVNGELPKSFSLPNPDKETDKIVFADGAQDGIGIYHMGGSGSDEETRKLMTEAVKAVSDGRYDQADELFLKLGKNAPAIRLIDDFQKHIADHHNDFDLNSLYEYGYHVLLDSDDRETIKYGLAILELFRTDDHEELKDVVRILGLSDEFTLFALFLMRKWTDANEEIFHLAQKVHSWGRIHAIERLEPNTDEIRRWLLLDGVHNDVMPAYSALACWKKTDAESVLRKGPDEEEFAGIRDILEGLLDEGPVTGISEISNNEEIVSLFLDIASSKALSLKDYELLRGIRIHYDETNQEITDQCTVLLESDACRTVVSEAVKEGNGISLALELKLDCQGDLLRVLKADYRNKNYLTYILMRYPEYKDETMAVARANLPLDTMKTSPGTTPGLGEKYWAHRALDFMLQELRKYPLEGLDFVETGLQCEPPRSRNMALSVLESWVMEKETPLAALLPEMFTLITRLREIEPYEKTLTRMDKLLSGEIIFNMLN